MALGSEGPPDERRWGFLIAFSDEEFQQIFDACQNEPVKEIVKTFRDGSLREQQELLAKFLPRCRKIGNESMYLYDCGTYAMRFFVERDEPAIIVINVERLEDAGSADPLTMH